MGSDNMGGAAAPVINLDDTNLEVRTRSGAATDGAAKELPPPLQFDDFASDAPLSGAGTSEFSQIDGQGTGSRNRGMFAILALMLVGLAVILFTGERDPLENLAAFFGDLFAPTPEDEGSLSVAANPEGNAPAEASLAAEDTQPPEFSADMVPNPYWVLPAELKKPKPSEEIMSSEDAELYANGMNHRFTYQRYRTAKLIRASKRGGSETYLGKATREPKFWTRMEGGLGLIERGYAIDVTSVERILGNARPSLIYNYMQRFAKKATASELYFMKQAIRLVDARTRLHILKILARDKERNELYFAAAQYDPSPIVTDWLSQKFGNAAVTDDVLKNFQAMAMQDVMQRGKAAPLRQPNVETVGGPVTVKAEEIKIDGEVVEDVAIFTDEEAPKIQTPDEVFANPKQSDDGFGDLTKLRENADD